MEPARALAILLVVGLACGLQAGAPAAENGAVRGAREGFPATSDHVRASATLKLSPNEDEIIVRLNIDSGYHINANRPSLDTLIPTSVAFARLKPSSVDYPKPVRLQSAFAPGGLEVYEGTVALIAHFPKGSLAGRNNILGRVRAQACDGETCLPPSDLPVSLPAAGAPEDRRSRGGSREE